MDPITQLSGAVDFWKAARLWVGIPTLALAAATFATQWMEMRRSRELATLQRELIRAKDDQLRRELSEKDIKIADANRASSQATAEAAKARLEQEKLKGQMAWRRISIEQAHILAKNLQTSNIELWLTFVGNDPEATIYREDLDKALTAAGLKTYLYSGYERAIGLGIRGGQAEQRAQILSAFKKAGIPIIETNEAGFMKDSLEMLVGTKPPPEFYH